MSLWRGELSTPVSELMEAEALVGRRLFVETPVRSGEVGAINGEHLNSQPRPVRLPFSAGCPVQQLHTDGQAEGRG